jgi:hypothetical protein
MSAADAFAFLFGYIGPSPGTASGVVPPLSDAVLPLPALIGPSRSLSPWSLYCSGSLLYLLHSSWMHLLEMRCVVMHFPSLPQRSFTATRRRDVKRNTACHVLPRYQPRFFNLSTAPSGPTKRETKLHCETRLEAAERYAGYGSFIVRLGSSDGHVFLLSRAAASTQSAPSP